MSPTVDGALDWGHSTVLARTVPAGNESEGDEAVHRHQAVLCVHNLSRFAQPAELALAKWAGCTPYEVLGRVPFPVITEEPYTITLPPYGFLWFDLAPEERPVGRSERRRRDDATALRALTEAWLGMRRVAPDGRHHHRARRRAAGGPPRPARHRGPGRGSGGPTSSWACAAWPTSRTSCAPGEEAALGLLDDEDGLAVCTDALRDAQLAPLLLATVRSVAPRPGPVAVLRDDEDATVIDCGDRGDLIVFPWLADAPRPDVDLMVALEAAGFNHVAAPLVRWVWEGRDLGVVQEPLADRSGGWALALTSLRDLYASRGSPEAAGGDFGAEARALGTMTARMHLALDRAFLRHHEPVIDWVDAAEAEIAAADAILLEAPGVADLVKWLREAEARLPVIRTHGDFQLARTARTDQGWVVSDCEPGGVLAGGGHRAAVPHWRTWPTCCGRCTRPAPQPRRSGTRPGGSGWPRSARPGRARNRRAFMTGYLGTPGISGLVGPDRDLVRRLVSFLELARSVRTLRSATPGAGGSARGRRP